MRTSIKIKFSAFLAILSLLTVLILSLLILKGIKVYQKAEYEIYLKQQAQRANIFFLQTLLAEENKMPQTFLENKGEEFADELELISGQLLALYDKKGELVSKRAGHTESDGIRKTLEYAINDKTAYLLEKDLINYLTPLKVANEQVGVVRFYYSLSGELEFYNEIKQLFINIGAGVFFLNFIIAYFYFSSYANAIIKLEKMVAEVREGHYETKILKNKDEIGRLSEGIHVMSGRILKTIHRMEDEQIKLNSAVNKLSLLDKQQKEFIGNVTHEFKTPLTTIKAYIDLLNMYPDDDTLLETSLVNIESETLRLYEMVEKVLQLSAVEKYDYEYNKEKLNVKEVIESVIKRLKGKVDKFGIKLQRDLTEVYIEADKDILTIILVNLLDNAIKYNNPNGSIFIKNYLAGSQVLIEIADTGIGIPKELLLRIFEPFFTVDKNRSREYGGSGLGLSLSKNYAEMQGGSLTILHSDQNGSTFRILFPAYFPISSK